MRPSIGILLRELARLYTQAQREYETDSQDTSSTQNHVIMELGQAGLLTQHELGKRLSLDKGWISRAVEGLVQAGLVSKNRHDRDRRNRWLQLTSKGNARYRALTDSLDARAEQLLQPFSTEQREHIYQALLLLLSGLEGELPQIMAIEADFQLESIVPQGESHREPSNEPEKLLPTLPDVYEPHDTELALALIEDNHSDAHETAAPASLSQIGHRQTETMAPAFDHAQVSLSSAKQRMSEPTLPPNTRIVGSRTLPSRPLRSSSAVRPSLSSCGLSPTGQEADTERAIRLSAQVTPGRDPARMGQNASNQPMARVSSAAASAAARPATPAATRSAARPSVSASASPPAAPLVSAAQPQATGSVLKKLLAQNSLFNKFLHREQAQAEPMEQQAAPLEVEPDDGILFQAAAQSDWNEIRNLLTANRLTIQGALNHLSNFVVATENGRVIATIGMEVYGDIGLIRSLVVASNRRGQKIAGRLVKRLIERARAKQISALYLLSGNADSLFLKQSFEKMARADMPTKLYVSSEMQGASSGSPSALRLILN